MIGGEDVDRLADRAGDISLPDGEPLRGQIFQASQAPQRFSERIEAAPGLGKISFRRGGDRRDHFLDILLLDTVHRASLR